MLSARHNVVVQIVKVEKTDDEVKEETDETDESTEKTKEKPGGAAASGRELVLATQVGFPLEQCGH